MLEKILSLDVKLFVLNGLGSETFDGLWLFITKQNNWIPLFYSLYVIYTKLGVKQTFTAIYSCFSNYGSNYKPIQK
jgi:undecaprenyl-diphosphatase